MLTEYLINTQEDPMPRTSSQWLFIIIATAAAVLATAATARAELTFSLEVRQTYEDNVIGLVADNPNIVGGGGSAASQVVGETITPAAGDTGGGGRGGRGGAQAPSIKRSGPGGGGGGGGALDDRTNPQPTSGGTVTSGTTGTTGAPAAGGEPGATRAKGDFSTSVSADIGSTTDLGNSLTLLLKADIEHASYSTVKQFDFTIGAVRAGISRYLTDDLLAKVMVKGATKYFDDNQRNSLAYGATFSLKESLTSSFWLKLVYDYEMNTAKSSLNSYQGDSYGIWAGYSPMSRSTFGLGYSYLIRNFDKVPPVLKLTSQTYSVDWTWDFYTKWSVNVGYDLELADSNLPGSQTTNNVYSVGLLFSY
jgi:hypothetical protein